MSTAPSHESDAFALRSERVLVGGKFERALVVVRGERIEAVMPPQADIGPNVAVHDVGNYVLMPGLVDTHVHVNEPGRTEWEGFETATRAAASGGITTIVDMPLNCSPVTTSTRALDQKLASLAGSSPTPGNELYIDTAFWGGAIPNNQQELRSLAEAGVRGCKAFLIDSGIDEFPHVGEEDLRLAMRELERAGIPLIAHAELDVGAPTPASSDVRRYSHYLASRPPEWEVAAIELLIRLCRETGCPVHIVHLSAAAAIPLIQAAKASGLPLTAETCPHYLCLHAEDIPDGATNYKCAPPIRERDNCDKLWQALREGVLDAVVSDHSPCTPALKKLDVGDFMQAWGGIASLSLGLGTVWHEAFARGFEPATMGLWMSERTAKLAGLSGKKGSIAPGADADFVVWDPDAEIEIGPELLFFKHKQSPFVGRKARGRVMETWLRGKRIFHIDEGKPNFVPAAGKSITSRR